MAPIKSRDRERYKTEPATNPARHRSHCHGQSILTTAASGADWLAISPGEAGFTFDLESLLDKAITEKRVWNLHGVVIVRKGRPVLEHYFEGDDSARGSPLGTIAFKADTLHDLRSVSKSIVGLLYGVALADGKVPPPEAPLFASFPEYADLAADPARKRWTIQNVLTMTMGTDWDEQSVPYSDPTNSETAMDMAPDRYRFVLGRPVVMEPGKRWVYHGGATALLARIIEKVLGNHYTSSRAWHLTQGRYRRDPPVWLPMVFGQVRLHRFNRAAVGPVAARALLGCDRQWRPAALCVFGP
jgi:Beta-lactamase